MTPRLSRDYGSILLGSAAASIRAQRIRIQTLLTVTLVIANTVGVVVAVALGAFGIPDPSFLRGDLALINFVAVPVYAGVAVLIGVSVGTVTMVRGLRWSIHDQVPTRADVAGTRRALRNLLILQFALWMGAAALLGTLYGLADPDLIGKVVLVVVMSALVVVAVSSLLTEILLRPVSAKILQAGLGWRGASIRWRAVLGWLIGTGIPLLGIFLAVLFGYLDPETSRTHLFVSVTVLTAVAAGVGLLSVILFAWSVTGPLQNVRDGMLRVRGGDIGADTDLVVYDSSELGELQLGFNNMVSGLREEARLRDLFSRHVGRDVAAAAMLGDPELGGSERIVAVVFVDVIGSTELALTRTPTEVVDLLNQFFAVIVDATEADGGSVNKFEGDAVLAIFGAPQAIDDPGGAALHAAREIADRLHREVPDLKAGIGVSHGTVVAGNVGAIQRFEYTVIGDPVNEAARLSEIAKRDPRVPWASGRVVEAAAPAERTRWKAIDEEILRGRNAPTELFVPRRIPYR